MMGMGARGGGPRYGDVPPNQTLYVNNLNEKIKIPELKCCLLELFSTYGEVIEIVAAGSLKKKGQAFLVFRDISCATNALRALQNFVFLDKPMRITYCKSKSDVIALEDGTFKPRAKAGAAGKEEDKKLSNAPGARGKVAAPGGAGVARGGPVVPKSFAAHPSTARSAPAEGGEGGQPSNVLFVQNLPAEVNEMMLTMLFRQYPGFQEARLIKGRNVAFIEYADELQAGIAKHGLQGFMVTPEMALKISFAEQ
mmetsp:Transcript_49252/g.107141  ORF Transcript_49252/g.107141 Transcript_49252/m.107141 type:complete len:253 (+) Transcript_49252:103-861(+)|eukprot:CAMPEP_0170599632 /NCGR_PEP_ID=MMETSP0224-20130122/16906_1 /TAXON_ID=285029 /ORGANISM="Togula jolla, Strain CCCM 725" /LENGTH=252 /DNA_ID=CAMNT_0010924307 /DNA_START=103 /DNA_END=861 /DNA_ORIENTATION=+